MHEPRSNAVPRPKIRPWRDAGGRLSPLKITALIAMVLPAMWMAYEVAVGNWVFPTPYVSLVYYSGVWATYLLLASLTITPLRKILRWGKLIIIRRIVGVSALFYTLGHIVIWFGLRFWDWPALANEFATRTTLLVAGAATAGLIVLGLTSFDSAIRWMGGRRWNALHRSVYVLAGLAVLHFMLSPGSLQGLPFTLAGIYIWLMLWRLLNRRGLGADPRVLLALAVLLAPATMLLEAGWTVTVHRERALFSFWEAIALNFDPQWWQAIGFNPAWVVLAWGLMAAGAAALAAFHARRMQSRMAAAPPPSVVAG